MYSLLSKKTTQLKASEIIEILRLKNSFWKFNIKSQKKWFELNVKRKDIHNLLFLDNKLIGYTLLRFRKIKNLKKFYFLLDTIIINKKFRKKKYGNLLMEFNNNIIYQNKKIGFLVCDKKEIQFYKKFKWKILNKKYFGMDEIKNFKYGMIFNNKLKNKFFIFSQEI